MTSLAAGIALSAAVSPPDPVATLAIGRRAGLSWVDLISAGPEDQAPISDEYDIESPVAWPSWAQVVSSG